MNSVQIDRTLTIKYSVDMTDGVAAEIDPLALESQVCFALAVTNRAVLAVYRPLLEPLGLTHPQYLVMLALWDNAKGAGEPLSVKDIARLLQMDSATLSPMLKRLQAQGLITRERARATSAPPTWNSLRRAAVCGGRRWRFHRRSSSASASNSQNSSICATCSPVSTPPPWPQARWIRS